MKAIGVRTLRIFHAETILIPQQIFEVIHGHSIDHSSKRVIVFLLSVYAVAVAHPLLLFASRFLNAMALGKLVRDEKTENLGQDAENHTVPNEELEKGGSPTYDDEARESQSIDPVMERRVVRKMDRNIIPLVMALCKNPSSALL